MTDTLIFGSIAATVIARCARCCMSCCRTSTGGVDDETARQAHERAAQGR